MADPTTISVRRAELLDLKRLQLAAEEAEGRKPTLSEIIRRALDALLSMPNGGPAVASRRPAPRREVPGGG